MKILLVGNYPNQSQPSMQRFARMLEDSLDREGIEVRLIRPQPVLGRLKPAAEGVGKWLGYIDRFVLFPWRLLWAKRGMDIVHICDHANAVYMPVLGQTSVVVSCHDLFGVWVARGEVEGVHTGRCGKVLVHLMINGLASASRVVCNTQRTQKELDRLVPARRGAKKPVVEYGLNYPYQPMGHDEAVNRLSEKGITDRSFIVHVGGNQWYKNRMGLLKIFAELRRLNVGPYLNLVMAGKSLTNEMRQFIENNNLNGCVLERSSLDNEDLRAIYSLGEALVWPSLAEGFGWPVIEAQACGCPVFASDRPPIPEVGGRSAVYFDPADPARAAAVIRDQWDQRQSQVENGFANAARYSVNKMVSGYVAVYDELYKKATPR